LEAAEKGRRENPDILSTSAAESALVECLWTPPNIGVKFSRTYGTGVTCGAPIEAINTVRKHISRVKGRPRSRQQRTTRQKSRLAVSDVPVGKERRLAVGAPTLPLTRHGWGYKAHQCRNFPIYKFPPSLPALADEGKMPGDAARKRMHLHFEISQLFCCWKWMIVHRTSRGGKGKA